MQSSRVGIRDAKMHLSKYLKMVQSGTEIIITDRGRPVGRIVPIQTRDLSLDDRIKKLEDRGVIEKSTRQNWQRTPPPIPLPDGIVQKFLQEDRNSG